MSATTTPAGAVPTIAMLVRERARRAPDAVAVRWKRHGIWCEVTWAQYRDDVRDTAQMLRDLGVGAGDRVAVLADNRYQWLLTDVATVALHGVTVAVDPTAEPDAVAAVLSGAAVTVVVAEDEEQIDKVLAAGETAGLRHIVYLHDRGVRSRYADARLRHWDEAVADARAGADHGGRRTTTDPLANMPDQVAADTVVTLAVSPDDRRTAPHLAVSAGDVDALVDRLGAGMTPPPSERDRVLPLVSLADCHERLMSTWIGAAAGVQVHFAESVTTVGHDLREVQPTIVVAPPVVWERLATDIDRRLRGTTWLKRWVWRLWSPLRGARAWPENRASPENGTWPADGAPLEADSSAGPAPNRVTRVLGHLIVYRALREQIGMRHVRHAVCSGPVSPATSRLLRGIGVPLEETETELTGTL